MSVEIGLNPPAEFGKFIQQEIRTWADVVKAAGINPK